jgi:hypothetical protein
MFCDLTSIQQQQRLLAQQFGIDPESIIIEEVASGSPIANQLQSGR